MQANIISAVALCREIEKIAPNFGCHVALTGGCLYKDGARKDIDILFYRIRQVEKIDHEGLKQALQAQTHQVTFLGLNKRPTRCDVVQAPEICDFWPAP